MYFFRPKLAYLTLVRILTTICGLKLVDLNSNLKRDAEWFFMGVITRITSTGNQLEPVRKSCISDRLNPTFLYGVQLSIVTGFLPR